MTDNKPKQRDQSSRRRGEPADEQKYPAKPRSSGKGSGSGGGGGSAGDRCSALAIRTHLQSPNSVVLATLRVGSKLSLQLDSKGRISAMKGNAVAGPVLGKEVAQLVECMNKGHAYVARVVTLDGGYCVIDITST